MRWLVVGNVFSCLCVAVASEICLPRFKDLLLKCHDDYMLVKDHVGSVPDYQKCMTVGFVVNKFETCVNAAMGDDVANSCDLSNEYISVLIPHGREKEARICAEQKAVQATSTLMPASNAISRPILHARLRHRSAAITKKQAEGVGIATTTLNVDVVAMRAQGFQTSDSGSVWGWLGAAALSVCCCGAAAMMCFSLLHNREKRHVSRDVVGLGIHEDSSTDSETDFLGNCRSGVCDGDHVVFDHGPEQVYPGQAYPGHAFAHNFPNPDYTDDYTDFDSDDDPPIFAYGGNHHHNNSYHLVNSQGGSSASYGGQSFVGHNF